MQVTDFGLNSLNSNEQGNITIFVANIRWSNFHHRVWSKATFKLFLGDLNWNVNFHPCSFKLASQI